MFNVLSLIAGAANTSVRVHTYKQTPLSGALARRAVVSGPQLGCAGSCLEAFMPTHHKLFIPWLLLSCSGLAYSNSINLFTLLFFCFCEFLLRRLNRRLRSGARLQMLLQLPYYLSFSWSLLALVHLGRLYLYDCCWRRRMAGLDWPKTAALIFIPRCASPLQRR
jgi:hypothetical protein